MSQSKRSSKDKYLDSLKKRYAKASKKERGKILDEYVQTTGYHRKHAIAILSGQYQLAPRPIRRPRKSVYTVEDAKALDFLSDLFDGINAKRLRAAMDVELDGLYQRGVLKVSRACYRRLKRISPASIDRLRARYGQPRPKSRHRTKPGTLLKSQIPIRTWAEWNEDRPGFVEMDLVGHDGGNLHGDYCLTLDFTDVKTGWTECVAVRNKAQKHVFEAIRLARRRLPFPLLGMDSDNGGEFINDELFRYCRDEHITFTRGRSGHKNDNAYVEQKNWSAVRRFVGDLRYDTPAQLTLLNQLYERLHLYLNFFIPVMKLKEKVRVGSKVKRVYDEPQTPYARVLASPDVAPKIKARLRVQYRQVDVVKLKQEIDELVDQLWQDPHRS
jgi:hypothetical protein